MVTNTGNVALTDLTLEDDKFGTELEALLVSYPLPESLAPGEWFERTISVTGSETVDFQHSNTATATGKYEEEVVDDSNSAHYITVAPETGANIRVKKFVSVDDGITWDDADEPSGPTVAVGEEVQFKFVVTNTGDVNLTGLTLDDDVFETELAALLDNDSLPQSLAPGASFERILTGIIAIEGQHSNTATATGLGNGDMVSDDDPAHYKGIVVGDDCRKVGSAWANIEGGIRFSAGNATYFEYEKEAGITDTPVYVQLGMGANYIKVGTLRVQNDNDTIYVKFIADFPYTWGVAHLYVGLAAPTQHAPGQLGFKHEPVNLFPEYEFELDQIFEEQGGDLTSFSAIEVGDTIYIAAHTDVWKCE